MPMDPVKFATVDFRKKQATIHYESGEIEILEIVDFHATRTRSDNAKRGVDNQQTWLRTEVHFTHDHESISNFRKRAAE